MVAALEGQKKTRKTNKKLRDNHTVFIENLIAYHAGELTLKIIKEALTINFPTIEGISLTSLSNFMKKQMSYSKRRASTRNVRVLASDRPQRIQEFVYELLIAKQKGEDIVNVDECGIVIGQAAGLKWAPKGTPNPKTQTQNPKP